MTNRATYNTNVFINCPFDDDYRPLFDALVFTILDAGFYPQSARAIEDSGQVRIQKIVDLIRGSRYSTKRFIIWTSTK